MYWQKQKSDVHLFLRQIMKAKSETQSMRNVAGLFDKCSPLTESQCIAFRVPHVKYLNSTCGALCAVHSLYHALLCEAFACDSQHRYAHNNISFQTHCLPM